MEKFKQALLDGDIPQLRTFIKKQKILSTHKFMTYVEKSFMTNRPVFDVCVLILLNQYDLDEVVMDIIDRNNTDLLDGVLSNASADLDKDLVSDAMNKGRIIMARTIVKYIYGEKNLDIRIVRLLRGCDYVHDVEEKSIDSFLTTLRARKFDQTKIIMSYIDLSFWNDFAIKYATSLSAINIVKRLLRCNSVDPSSDDNLAYQIAMNDKHYHIANELLKHPLVRIIRINLGLVNFLIESNCLCVVEKIFNSTNDDAISFFKRPEIIHKMFHAHNDITYLAMKMDIMPTINHEEIIKNLPLYQFKPYVEKPYELQLDPAQVIKRAIKYNDLDLALSIKNYSVSINAGLLFCYLILYDEPIDPIEFESESVCQYIWSNAIKQYNPNDLLLEALIFDRNTVLFRASNLSPNRDHCCENYHHGISKVSKTNKTIGDKILDLLHNNPELNHQYVYNSNDQARREKWQSMKKTYDTTQCKTIIEYLIKENFISEPLPGNFDQLSKSNKISALDNAFDKFVF